MSAILPPGAERIVPLEDRLPALLADVVREQLELAIDTIDAVLGAGYAEKHAALIAGVLATSAAHARTETLAEELQALTEQLGTIGRAAESIAETLRVRSS